MILLPISARRASAAGAAESYEQTAWRVREQAAALWPQHVERGQAGRRRGRRELPRKGPRKPHRPDAATRLAGE
jgi:hypothetical protein